MLRQSLKLELGRATGNLFARAGRTPKRVLALHANWNSGIIHCILALYPMHANCNSGITSILALYKSTVSLNICDSRIRIIPVRTGSGFIISFSSSPLVMPIHLHNGPSLFSSKFTFAYNTNAFLITCFFKIHFCL